jgi:ArsR family transcriptional regulator, arsenate/arsenite/antimonite-responsive transcriptional repressor
MDELTKFYKLLSDETRVRILMLLKEQNLCVCQLCGIMKETQPKISKHLAKLRDLNIIEDDRQKQFVFYSLSKDNDFYIETLENIKKRINDYPILKRDLENSTNPKCFIDTII